MATADELYLEAKCFLCYGMTQAQALKLALLRRKALELDPDADVTPETLLLNASCYNCYANGSIYDLLELALLAIIAGTPCPPAGNVDGLIWGPNPETVDSIAGSADALTLFTDAFFPTSAYTEFSFGNPVTVTNSIDFGGSSVITSFTMRLLETVGVDIVFSSCTGLLSVSFENLTSVGGNVAFDNATSLASVNMNSLATVGADLDFQFCSALIAIGFPSLTTIGARMLFTNCASLTSINLPLLASIGTDAVCDTTGLISLSLPALITIGGLTDFSQTPTLTSFSAPLWVPTDGTSITFSNDALDATSVELILRRCVLAGVATCTIDLSGGTNAGTASLSAQGQADVATLGAQLTINP